MNEILWILGVFAAGTIGFFFGIIANKWGYEQKIFDMKHDMFDIAYDWTTPPEKKAPLVFRIKRLDEHFGLDEIRATKGEHELIIEDKPRIATDDLSNRVCVADGEQGMRRGE